METLPGQARSRHQPVRVGPGRNPFLERRKRGGAGAGGEDQCRAGNAAGAALCRGQAEAADRAAGHGHQRQGRGDPAGVRGRQPAGGARRLLQGADRARAGARLPVARAPAGARPRGDGHLQPQPLRGRAGGARAQPGARRAVEAAL